jgi:hypothetical protein
VHSVGPAFGLRPRPACFSPAAETAHGLAGWFNRSCPSAWPTRVRARGHHALGAGGGVAANDGGVDPVGIDRWIELMEGMGAAPDMERRAAAYPSDGLMARKRVWLGAVLENGEERRRR